MSNRNLRNLESFDYKIVHNTGEKVAKSRDMAMRNETILEVQVAGDIKELFVMYRLEDLVLEDEINEGLNIATRYCKMYRDIHVNLKLGLPDDYEKTYRNYNEILSKLQKYVKDAREKIRELKMKGKESLEKRDVMREKSSLESQHDFFLAKVERRITSLEWDLMDELHEINSGVAHLESSLDEWYDLNGKLKGLFENYDDLYEKGFMDLVDRIVEKIDQGKKRAKTIHDFNDAAAQKIEEDRISATKEKLLREKNRSDMENAECKNFADNLYREIKVMNDSITESCAIDLKKIGDHQLLDLKKNVFHLTSQLKHVMEKITSFSKVAVHCGDDEKPMMKELSTIRVDLAKKVTQFSNELGTLIREKDITEEKLKSSKNLKIELPKFKGFESDMDIYTFQKQFKKLIQPALPKGVWADYLKRNYLSGSALTLVEKMEDVEEIWKKLQESYGNMRFLLQKKIACLDKEKDLWTVHGDEKKGLAIASLINLMSDLSNLASTYDLVEELYYGGSFEKILSLLGHKLERKFVSKGSNPTAKRPEEWVRLVKFLEKELETCNKLTVLEKSKKCLGIVETTKKKDPKNSGRTSNNAFVTGKSQKCHICDETGHTGISNGKENVPYFACKKFVEMTPDERRKIIFSKKLCAQCLQPGVKFNEEHECSNDYCCPDKFHLKFKKGLHVLLCSHHSDKEENLEILEKYRKNVIEKTKNLETFSKMIKISCYSRMFGVSRIHANSVEGFSSDSKIDTVITDSAIFLLQAIEVEGVSINLFFDSGCGDMVIKKSTVDKLKKVGRANLELPGEITLSGIGDKKSVCKHGIYSVCLPLKNGLEAVLSGLCLDKVTADFPIYPLDQVMIDLEDMWKDEKGNPLNKSIPKIPNEVGGDTDILLGIKYVKYFPELVHMFPSGLSVYTSAFLSSDGSDGIVAGPHPEFTKAEMAQKGVHASRPVYFLQQTMQYWARSSLESEIPLLSGYREKAFKNKISDSADVGIQDVCVSRKLMKAIQNFEEVQNAGTEISYRCVGCRDCEECRKSPRLEKISIQEEAEQSLIDRSVEVDIERGITTAALPFLTKPDNKLVPNEHLALKIYNGQIRKLEKRPDDKKAVIESENKLQQLGFVEYFDNLTDDDKALFNGQLQNYIPWRVVWNENSLSTYCRMVFDASHSAPGGCSLNSLLAKGVNTMNKLIEILIRWTTRNVGFHTDIQKMYNAVYLKKEHWRYQMYLWNNDLEVGKAPLRKVIKSLIYGVTSSGNLAETALRKLAEMIKDLYPRVFEIIMRDLYVDDCLSGESSKNEVLSTTDDLKLALEKAGFKLKGFTFSGSHPPEHLSKDGETVVVGGLKWFSKGDFISINIKELNFGKKNRGRKNDSMNGIVPVHLTKRHCLSKVAEIFDPLGKVTPLVSGMKLDIHELHARKLHWDDVIPDDFRKIWVSNFEMMKEIGRIKFHRAVVPKDAVDLSVETIDTGDASTSLICAAIYARFKRKNGEFSCQLIFARSKIVPAEMSVPRKELMAATLNATTGHVVKLALGDMHKKCWKLTDSQVALFWISCTRAALDVWVRNRVIEINRLANAELWSYVMSRDMCADLGTRKGARIEDVSPESEWICGREWMKGAEADFPLKTVGELVLEAAELSDIRKECIVFDTAEDDSFVRCLSVSHFTHVLKNNYSKRYEFSNYVIDPLKFRFRKVIRTLALVYLFIKKIKAKRMERSGIQTPHPIVAMCHPIPKTYQGDNYILTTGGNKFNDNLKCKSGLVVQLTNEMISVALQYFHKKATAELLKFVDKNEHDNISEIKNNIMYYSGRILSTQEFGGDPSLCKAALDLTESTFCVPMTDSNSPIARAVVSETHWHNRDVKHGGLESTLRIAQREFYIIGGRDLVKSIKNECIKCRILEKRKLKVIMGPIQDVNLCIAPPFYNCQVDLCGPFNAYSIANKRATIKIWFVVFCCCTTSAVDCRTMEDYSTDSFLLSFIRFSCRYGYPKQLLPDAGSQLLKGCKDAIISFSSLQHMLSTEYGVDFTACPVGAHYMHGKVERKIQQVKKCMAKELNNHRLSIIQWETLGLQIANSINNLPLGLGNKTDQLENLDILTPNRLILGRNNDRCPTQPLELTADHRKIIESNVDIFRAWFNTWLISYVPTLMKRSKWHADDGRISVGDVVLFLKSEQEFDLQYQYGIVKATIEGKDGKVRKIEVEYQNHKENVKRTTIRGVRDVIVIHTVEEMQ